MSQEDVEEYNIRKYPFFTMMHINPTNINPSPVRMSIKRPSEFIDPNVLSVIKEPKGKILQLKDQKQKTQG